jgi:hypothetical protein
LLAHTKASPPELVKYQQLQDEPLTRDRAKSALAVFIEDGTVSYTRHFREELAKDDLTIEDVLAVCRSGAIVLPPENGRAIAVVFALIPKVCVFITVFERTA